MLQTFPVLSGFLIPHPPVIVPEVGRGSNQAVATVAAIRQAAADLAHLEPETVVVISPHAPMFGDYLYIYDTAPLSGNLGQFGAAQVQLSWEPDQALIRALGQQLASRGIAGGSLTPSQQRQHHVQQSLDHGCLVPLYFLRQEARPFRLVALASSDLPLAQIYAAGQAITAAAASLGRRIVIVASGDLSHKANDQSPYGSCPEGSEFDRELTSRLQANDLPGVLSIDPDLRERAAECGYRSIVMLCGAFSETATSCQVLGYEAPYGIGYGVARLLPDPSQPAPAETTLAQALKLQARRSADRRLSASPPVVIASQTLEHFLRTGERLQRTDFPQFANHPAYLRERAGVFVSLKKSGELRGCIGTTQATTASVLEEIIQNALSAGLHDPRFDPVGADELPFLTYSVDILSQAEPVGDRGDLDPRTYGVIVRSGGRSGLLLPDLEGVDTSEDQLAIACRKAGIDPRSDYRILRFTVTRYH